MVVHNLSMNIFEDLAGLVEISFVCHGRKIRKFDFLEAFIGTFPNCLWLIVKLLSKFFDFDSTMVTISGSIVNYIDRATFEGAIGGDVVDTALLDSVTSEFCSCALKNKLGN